LIGFNLPSKPITQPAILDQKKNAKTAGVAVDDEQLDIILDIIMIGNRLAAIFTSCYNVLRKKVLKHIGRLHSMYEIYTDGSCLGNPGRGGWGVVSDHFILCDNERNTTNNIMEMTAIIKALEECVKREILEVRIFTDSNYVKNGISSWIINWKRNGWKTSTGADVKNKELWIAMDEARKKLTSVEWKWVKAHNGHPKNEQVDKLARECANKLSV
jgi:ribonuclease HI